LCRKMGILIITIRLLLSPRSFPRPPIGIPCGLLSASGGEGRAYHVPGQSQDRLGLASTPVATSSTMPAQKYSIPAKYLFGHSVSASCAVFRMTASEWRFRFLDHTIGS